MIIQLPFLKTFTDMIKSAQIRISYLKSKKEYQIHSKFQWYNSI